MVNAFDSTIWPPTPITPEVKALLAHFFDLIDAPDPEGSGQGLAEEVFTEDGTLITGNGTFRGKEGMCTFHESFHYWWSGKLTTFMQKSLGADLMRGR